MKKLTITVKEFLFWILDKFLPAYLKKPTRLSQHQSMHFNPTKVSLNSFSIISKILSAHCGQILAQEVGKIVQKSNSVTISDFFFWKMRLETDQETD